MSRALLLGLLLALALPLRAVDPPATSAGLEASTDAFGRFVATKMHLLLCEMALLDPETLAERGAERESRLAEQARLDAWFDSFDRDVGPEDLQTDADRANYRDFPRVMASRDFLALPYAERVAFVRRSDAQFAGLSRGLGPVLVGLSQDGAGRPHPALLAYLEARVGQNMGVGARWFGRGSETTVAAVYLPFTRSIYLNISYMHDDPAGFFDAFEHEMWHHILPVVNRETASRNLWWEGCAEAVSEVFSADLQPYLPRDAKPDLSVSYPVQAAWVSLLLGVDRAGALALWTGVAEETTVLAGWRAGSALQRRLAEQWAGRHHVDAARKAALEAILSDWGWKEDDGSRIDIANLLTADQLDPEKVAVVFGKTRDLLLDLAAAMSVLDLQALQQEFGDAALLQAVDLPSALARNLRAVLLYVPKPRRLYRAIDYDR